MCLLGKATENTFKNLSGRSQILHGFIFGRRFGTAWITKLPGENGEVTGRVESGSEAGVDNQAGLRQHVQIMGFPKDPVMIGQKAFDGLFASLLTMKQGIFDEGRRGIQIYFRAPRRSSFAFFSQAWTSSCFSGFIQYFAFSEDGGGKGAGNIFFLIELLAGYHDDSLGGGKAAEETKG